MMFLSSSQSNEFIQKTSIVLSFINDSADVKAQFHVFHSQLNQITNNVLSEEDTVFMLCEHVVCHAIFNNVFSQQANNFVQNTALVSCFNQFVEQLQTNFNFDIKDLFAPIIQECAELITKNTQDCAQDKQKSLVFTLLADLFSTALSMRNFEHDTPQAETTLDVASQVIDFINNSVNDLLIKEFNTVISNDYVQIIEPFTSQANYLSRLIEAQHGANQQGLTCKCDSEGKFVDASTTLPLITAEQIKQKSQHMLSFAMNPIMYYLANVQMSYAYAQQNVALDKVNQHMIKLADVLTFTTEQVRNLCAKQDKAIQVIIGNTPLNSLCASTNDKYSDISTRVISSYTAENQHVNKMPLLNSHIFAIKQASDLMQDKGIIAFITPSNWIESVSGAQMRKCLQQEFSSIYVYHLKGNRRVPRIESDAEGGNICINQTRSALVITFLVKNPQAKEQGKIYFDTVTNGLSAQEKLQQLAHLGSILNANLIEITPNAHHEWINQRSEIYSVCKAVEDTKDSCGMFKLKSNGVRLQPLDIFCNSSKEVLKSNVQKSIATCKQLSNKDSQSADFDKSKLYGLVPHHLICKDNVEQDCPEFDSAKIRLAYTRPFIKSFIYLDKFYTANTSKIEQIFPNKQSTNLVIAVSTLGARTFSCHMFKHIPLFEVVSLAHYYPRYIYKQDMATGEYVRESAITDETIEYFKEAYPEHQDKIDADAIFFYMYGLINSDEYQKTFANSLLKDVLRLPRVATYEDFAAFAQAGRMLANLHTNEDSVEPYSECEITGLEKGDFKTIYLHYGKRKDQANKFVYDKSVIIYNDDITISNIPLKAHEYIINGQSALDTVIARCRISINKSNHIEDNYNNFAQEQGDEKYILNLILRVINISLQTREIIEHLPKMQLHTLDIKQ